MPGADLLVVAGEASGDLHGARLLAELRRSEPALQAFGLGGDELQAAGLDLVARQRGDLGGGPRRGAQSAAAGARDLRRSCSPRWTAGAPRCAVLIDFPEFNLRLAEELQSARACAVVYYISPQVWAWRKGGCSAIARDVDRMLVLFPFEVEFYRRHGVEVVHVGHPLVDEVPSPAAGLGRADAGDGTMPAGAPAGLAGQRGARPCCR